MIVLQFSPAISLFLIFNQYGIIHIVYKIFQKSNISYPLIHTWTCVYQGTKILVFWKNCIITKGTDLTLYKKINFIIKTKLYSKALAIGYTTIFWNILHLHLVFCSKHHPNWYHKPRTGIWSPLYHSKYTKNNGKKKPQKATTKVSINNFTLSGIML